MAGSAEALRRGDAAPDFALPGTDGRTWRYADAAGPNGLVVMFICNHCPYVKAVIDRIVGEVDALRALGVGAVAISSNDASAYPEDSFENMLAFAHRHRFGFAYLHDESQEVARAYGAVCTPDFFGFDRQRVLRYRGRLDASGRQPAGPGVRRELYEAMKQLVETGAAPTEQTASIGCSIKWKHA
jgi:peroxiredoxin